MSDFELAIIPTLTPDQARAAAASYGWSVLPHDNGGFSAQCGQWRMIVTFAEDGSFRHASVKEGRDGFEASLMENSVVDALAMRGTAPERPTSSEEKTA
ncbi:hypothetical protein [Streptomyces murinus]|uniref:hypothetical protein n=1 Tax=Streptomyces murinus TaxID=33900 RepID=UPI00381CBF2E